MTNCTLNLKNLTTERFILTECVLAINHCHKKTACAGGFFNAGPVRGLSSELCC